MNPGDYPVRKTYAWYVFVLLLLLLLFGLMDRVMIAAILPRLKSDWMLSDARLGALVSAVNWSMAAFALPAAILVDRWSRKKAICLMAMLWTLATLACGLSTSFVQLFCARLFIGAGEGGYGPGGSSMISALLPRRLHATALGIFMAAGSLGGVLGVAVGGYVAARWGWRQAFFAVAIPGLAIALLFMLTVRDIPTAPLKVMDQTSGEQRKLMFRDVLRNLFCTRSLVAVYLAGIGYVFFAISLIAWLPSYFARVEGLPMDRAAARSALVLLTTSCGTAIGGVVIDRLSSWRTDMMLVAPAVFAVISAASIASAFTWLNGNSSLTALLTGAFFSMTGLGSLYAVTQRVVYPGLRATGIGVTNLIWQTLGGMGPLITGVVSDAVGIRQAIACDTLALLFCAIAMFVGSRTLQSDASRISAL